jgi:signal transduction histidine kinase
MTEKTARRTAMGLWIAVVLMCALGIALASMLGLAAASSISVLSLAVLAYATVGAVIAANTHVNPVGWFLVAASLAVALAVLAAAIGGLATSDDPNAEFGATIGWILTLVPYPVAPSCLILAFLYFPDGALASRWRRPLVWSTIAGGLSLFVGFLGRPLVVELRPPDWTGWLPAEQLLRFGAIALAVGALGTVASLALRYRRAEDDDRRAIKWVVRSLLALVIASAVMVAFIWLGFWPGFAIAGLAGVVIVFFGLPTALVVGVLGYRMYDVEVAIRKGILGTVLISYVFAVFLSVAFAVGETMGFRARWLPLVAGIILGAGIGPARRWLRRGVDRLLYGERATPYQVLTEFGERAGETYSTEDVLPRMAQLLASGTGASGTRVWLRIGDELQDAARWPTSTPKAPSIPMTGTDLPGLADEQAFPVHHRGDVLGALAMNMPPNDPTNPAKERLARDLAAQAGLVLRNVRLVEELQESRRRIVSAQDARARTLERNIHDGAQQQLVALAVKLRLAEQLVERDPEKARALLGELQADGNDALEDLRDLARGIYPPLLADQGLAAALQAQARRSVVPVTVEGDGIGRFPQDVEAAVYFCSLEALQNVAKYAHASRATVRLVCGNGSLAFDVIDDGVGFQPGDTLHGTGLQGMSDRLAALGGTLEVRSAPGSGTSISGRIPLEEMPGGPGQAA